MLERIDLSFHVIFGKIIFDSLSRSIEIKAANECQHFDVLYTSLQWRKIMQIKLSGKFIASSFIN